MNKKGKNRKQPKPFFIDRIIGVILSPIIKPLIYINDLLFPAYEEVERPLRPNELCICESNKQYSKCHLPKHKKTGKIAVKITKTFRKTRKSKVSFKVKSNEKLILGKFKAGSINPLNKKGNFVDTTNFEGDDGI